ncbi:Conidiophore development protein hymA [Penicillium oxalicum]|uniref:Conidiophore development protein hymA n=1 Tax=Penicillium oxalicum TaxID=69781 RepID=UPI0020B7455B|nr:Conidiophore development protein hymA [Penicillium oxalicum]KAI2793034.1 Conidiophore development protein hymA [Penicillium oxalicum]
MSFFFNRGRSRQPADVADEELAKQLAQMKIIVQGTQEITTSPDQVHALVQATLQEDLLFDLSRTIHLLPFEARKDTQTIFSHILRFRPAAYAPDKDPPVISYIVHNRPEVLVELCRGYNQSQSAMPCGVILREALKFDVVTAVILYDQSNEGEPAVRLSELKPNLPQSGNGVFWNFFHWIDKSNFEVSADAFTTFREILTRHKSLVTAYLATNFDLFFGKFNNILIQSDSYVTKRQSIKLLGEILLDRANYNVMMAYVESGDNLKLCMKLLRDDRKMVQYEGFHVFKVSSPQCPLSTILRAHVFVANPNKSMAVQRILINNRDRLLRFLPKFLEDRTDDDQFTDEKSFLVRQIELLPREPVDPGRPSREAHPGHNTAAAV